MTEGSPRDKLLEKLRVGIYEQDGYRVAEDFHKRADLALIEYINDPEITEAFEAINKWYA